MSSSAPQRKSEAEFTAIARQTATHFEGLGLSEVVVRMLHQRGFTHPTTLQAMVIPPALRGRDVVALAPTGAGKSIAIALSVAEHLIRRPDDEVLIVTPTADGAAQIHDVLRASLPAQKWTMASLFTGSMRVQQRELLRKPNVILTPAAALLDHWRRRSLHLAHCEVMILDDAEQMLDQEFLPNLIHIVRALPEHRLVMFFAAEPSPAIKVAANTLRFPELIDLHEEAPTRMAREDRVYLVRQEDKRACLTELVRTVPGKTLVLVRRHTDAEWLYQGLLAEQCSVERIHSGRTLLKCEQALDRFRSGLHSVLICSDAAPAAPDVHRLSHLINYDAPESVSHYLEYRRRRAGRDAVVSTIATWQDLPLIRAVETATGRHMTRCNLPGIKPWNM